MAGGRGRRAARCAVGERGISQSMPHPTYTNGLEIPNLLRQAKAR